MALSASRATPLMAVVAAAFAVAQVWPRFSHRAVVFTILCVGLAITAGMLFGTSLRAARSIGEKPRPIVGVASDPPGRGLLNAQARSLGLSRSRIGGNHVFTDSRGFDSPTSARLHPQVVGDIGPTDSGLVERQIEASGVALRALADRGATANSKYLWKRLTDRLDHISSMAVFVGQYQDLRNEERLYDLDRSVVKTLLAAPIPRAVWKGKPIIGRGLGLLYFGDGSNSYAMTPMVELLRNGGWPWVVVGMAVLGFLLAVGFRASDSAKTGVISQAVFATLVIRVVNYEAGYASIFADGLRVVFVTLAAVFFIKCVAWLAARVTRLPLGPRWT